MAFRVIEVLEGNTFKVFPNWSWHKESGNIVKVYDYDTPEKGEVGYEKAKKRLKNLILNEKVEIKNPQDIDKRKRLIADIYYRGKNLIHYLSENQWY